MRMRLAASAAEASEALRFSSSFSFSATSTSCVRGPWFRRSSALPTGTNAERGTSQSKWPQSKRGHAANLGKLPALNLGECEGGTWAAEEEWARASGAIRDRTSAT